MSDGSGQTRVFPIIHEFIDDRVGLHAFIVIDSLKNGHSCGGLRISEDLTLEEVKTLAKAMTFKYCFLKRNTGGAKAGIILPKNCTHEQRTKILEAFGRSASSLLRKGTYVPWTDLNSSSDDIAIVMKAAGCRFLGMSDSSYFTALTVVSAVKAACETKEMDISAISIIIEGFGAVGMNIASECAKLGIKIIGVSTIKGALYDPNGLDVNKLIELKKQYQDDLAQHYGKEWIQRKECLLEMDTDVLIPCARTGCINTTNMDKIKAKMIVPGANAPLTKEAEDFLHKKRILCLPDFVCNVGGVFGTNLYDNRNDIPTVHHFIMDEFGQLVKEILWASVRKHCLPSDIAKSIVEKHCNTKFDEFTGKTLSKKIFLKWFNNIIYFLHFLPRLQPWIALQRQRKIFLENIRYVQKCM
ncbi:MAG: Glu/Leu/Phe/Val dehydrogenase [Candidatus Thermoplasmatota archaeon]|nr:Glu/Leu/Phe/Val dehydrogenase [Candidatus Thermoplasmatota archaeon]